MPNCDIIAVEPCPDSEARVRVTHYLARLAERGAPIESYFEERLLQSRHFAVRQGPETIGLYSIENEALLTHFEVDSAHRRYERSAFAQALQTLNVREALVATFDESFLAMTFDHQRSAKTQAYLFCDAGDDLPALVPDLTVTPATSLDKGLILALSGDFFDKIDERLAAGQLSVVRHGIDVCGFGIVERGKLTPSCTAIGMFVVPEHRGRGIGSSILINLKNRARHPCGRVVAGCWYYNHPSRRALQNAGLWPHSRLLRIQF